MINSEELKKEIPVVDTPGWAAHIERDGYYFCRFDKTRNIYDAIIIINHNMGLSLSPRYPKSKHSLDEHISLINKLGIEKARIIGTDISFITRCPSLKHLDIYPSQLTEGIFDYSPLYDLPQISQLCCQTQYGRKDELKTEIDYSRIKGLKSVAISGRGHLNYNTLEDLEELYLADFRGRNYDLRDAFSSKELRKIILTKCSIKSLDGLTQSEHIETVELNYCSKLENVSQLSKIKNTLTHLKIRNCPKIVDFTFLYSLENLEYLYLEEKNSLLDLNFLPQMPKLEFLYLGMNVLDGDLTHCLDVPYAVCDNHRHYNLTDSQLPKNNPKNNEN